MDRQIFKDRLLGNENLTDSLEDDEANQLLDWGIAQIDKLIDGIDDQEAASEKVNGLMHVMRGLNSLAGNPSRASHEAVVDLLKRYEQIAGEAKVDEGERRSVADRVSKMKPGEAVQFLTEWLQKKKS